MHDATAVWLQFGACAALIAVAGTKLSAYADVIADKTGLSGNWIGLILLATVTSLPELATGISSVTIADAPNIAVGDVLGSCVFNLAILVVLDFLHRGESVYRRANQGHILSAGFGIVLIGVAGLNLLLGDKAAPLAIGHVGASTPLIVALYLIAMRALFSYERDQTRAFAGNIADRYPKLTLRRAVIGYAAAATVIVVAGIWLPFIGVQLASVMAWHKTFVGTLFVAIATSLPELAVTVAALRIGALDMAIGNLLGSNLFNIVILALDDLFFLKGPLLGHVSSLHAVSALSALVMTGIVIVGLLYRPRARILGAVGWISLGLLTVYLLNSFVLYLYGE
jgi:cation:H+ antiporter